MFMFPVSSLSDEDKIFIQEVFSGCMRYDMAVMVKKQFYGINFD